MLCVKKWERSYKHKNRVCIYLRTVRGDFLDHKDAGERKVRATQAPLFAATEMLQLSHGRGGEKVSLQSLIVSPQRGHNAQPGWDQVTGCMAGRGVSVCGHNAKCTAVPVIDFTLCT